MDSVSLIELLNKLNDIDKNFKVLVNDKDIDSIKIYVDENKISINSFGQRSVINE